MTYANISKGKVVAIAMFVVAEPVERVPCFQFGGARLYSARNAGLSGAIVAKSIEDISRGFKATGLKKFYVEAVVGRDKLPSNKIAA